MYLEKAKKLLNEEYQKRCAENITGFRNNLMQEKIRHSYQVLGAGNFILRHEQCFQNCLKEETDYLQAMILLHDIARFYEVIALSCGKKIDHGVYGAEMLSKIKEFQNIDFTMPIKHHGHLIKDLYQDIEYQKLFDDLKQRVERNAFLVRDADKLANFYLIVSHFNEVKDVFFVEDNYENPYSKVVNGDALADFMAHDTVHKSHLKNFADHALCFISWIFDLNYKSSFLFVEKLNIEKRLFNIAEAYWEPEQTKVFRHEIEQFIKEKLS